MGSAEKPNGQPDPETVIDTTPTKDHPVLSGIRQRVGKTARIGGRAAYRGATYVPRQTARAGKDFLVGKRRKHAGRVFVAGAVATVALGVGAYRTAENIVEDFHMPDVFGLDQDTSVPQQPEQSALNPEQQVHIGALVTPFLNALPADEQRPTIKYIPNDEGKSGYAIDTDTHEIEVRVNTNDLHDDLQTAQVLAHVASLEYLDHKLEGALSNANDAAEEALTDMNDQIAVGSNRGDQLSPAKKQFLNEKLDWDSADEFIKIITTARLLPEQLVAYISQAENNSYGTDAAIVKAVLKTRLQALKPLVSEGQTFPEYLSSIGFDPRIIEIASVA